MSDTGTLDRKTRLLVAEGLLLVLVALACLVFQLTLPSKAVADADYEAVARLLAAERQPGDVVLLHPWWTERARIFLPDGLPVVGFQGSDGAPLTSAPRIWVLDQPKQPRAGEGEFLTKFLPERTQVGAERTFGNLTLRLFSNGRFRPQVFSASEALARAQVYVESPDGSRRACAWTGRSWRCPGGEVGVAWHEEHFEPRRCIRLMPPGGEARTVVELDQVPASDVLELLAAYTWEQGYYRASATISDAELGFEVNGVTQPLPMPAPTIEQKRLEVRGTPDGSTVRVWSKARIATARDLCFELTGWGKAP